MANRLSQALAQLIALVRQPPAPSTLVVYPRLRNFIHDVMAEGRRKNTINLLFEADLTALRAELAEHQHRTGERLSLTAAIARALAQAVSENKAMHAYRHGKKCLVIFDDIDLSMMVEREIDGSLLPVASIIRDAQSKSTGTIHRELQAAKTAPLGATGPMSALEKTFFELPRPLRKLIWYVIRWDPNLFKQLIGTVGVTSMGMHAIGPAVVIPITPMTLTLSIGAISSTLVLEQGVPIERDVIQLNLGADHDIIDGAPLMRFADRFKSMLEGRI